MNLIDMLGPYEHMNPEPLPAHIALVCGRDGLLAEAVSAYLEGMSWKVIQVPKDGNDERLVGELRRVNPEVVILCGYEEEDDTVLPLRLIHEQLCLKVVTLGMDSNMMHIYSRQDFVLQGATDFLSIIEPGQYSNCALRREVRSPKQKDQ